MGRGRSRKAKNSLFTWKQLYQKNEGVYFQVILSQISKSENIGSESAVELLKNIRLEKTKISKKKESVLSVSVENFPHAVPSNWIWCSLQDMSISRDGDRKPISQGEREKREKIYDYYGASGVIDKIDGFTHEGELLLIGEDGANLVSRSTPVAFIATGKFWVNNHAHVLDTVDRITLAYLCVYLNSIDLKPYLTGGFQPKLSQGKLNTIPIPLPPLSEQTSILTFLKDLENESVDENKIYFDKRIETQIIELHQSQLLIAEILSEQSNQLNLVKQLRQSFLREAMQGKLLGTHESNKENQETGQQLLEKIKAEKAQLIKDRKLKKEKELPPIKQEEIPFAIPENWVWCRLGEVGRITGGGTPSMSNPDYWEGQIPWISPKDMKSEIVSDSEMKVTELGVSQSSTNLIPAGSLLIVGRSGILKRKLPVAINIVECTANQDMKVLIPHFTGMNRFLQLMLFGLEDIILKGYVKYGMTVHSLKYQEFEQMPIPLPPLKFQILMVSQLESLFQTCYQLEESVKQSQRQNEQLLQQVLREALEVKSSDENTGSTKQIIEKREEAKIFKLPVLQPEEDFYYQKRKALATYILNQSLSDPYLGDVKFMKLLHLADYHAVKRNLGQKFFQQAAGPYDNIFIHQYFKEIEGDNWFARVKKGERFHFSLGINHQESLKMHSYFTQDELNEVNKLIDLFKRDNYERPEVVSTLFAVWNNRIIKGEEISDELLMQDFLNWDSKKDKYRFRLKNELQWMRDKGIVPEGWGKIIEKSKNKRNAQAK